MLNRLLKGSLRTSDESAIFYITSFVLSTLHNRVLTNIKNFGVVCQVKYPLLNCVLMLRKRLPLLLLILGGISIFASLAWYLYSQRFTSGALTVESVPEA